MVGTFTTLVKLIRMLINNNVNFAFYPSVMAENRIRTKSRCHFNMIRFHRGEWNYNRGR
uniref:Uncharacterized protein n=1 Tax=Octopus bimaculoides TaxID=37653 RepID=A0A0L8G024_OCTBM